MLLEYYTINWWLLLSNFIWILGAAIIIAAFSYIEFLIWKQKIKTIKFFTRRSFKKYLFLSLVLPVVGLILSSFNFSKNPSPSKFIFIDYNICDLGEIEKYYIGESLNISVYEMIMSRKYPVRNNKISMPWNGYIGTPFIKFASGHYAVEFEAYGSEAHHEFSKIYVFFLVMKNKKLVLNKIMKTIELKEKKKYRLKFEVDENKIGKIRIQFFNDDGDEKGGDRNVWIGALKIIKIKGPNTENF